MANLAKAEGAKRKRKNRDPIQQALRQPKSLRLAIKAKCYDCEGQNADPEWAWRIGNCIIPDCPLYLVRPFRAGTYRATEGDPIPEQLRDTPYATDVLESRETADAD
jgi:hypothetical protein